MKKIAALFCLFALGLMGAAQAETYPKFKFDPAWPKQMPHGYFFGQIAGMTTDTHGNIWVISRPRSIVPQLDEPPQESSGVPAPAVVEFDAKGNFLRGWGGTYMMSDEERSHFDWPVQEHGIAVDNTRQRLDLRQRQGPQDRQGRQPVPEVHHRRQIPHADRPCQPEQGQPGYRESQPRRLAGLLRAGQ